MKMVCKAIAADHSPPSFAQVAEADGNRTRQRRSAALTGFEDRGDHQVPRRLRVDSSRRPPGGAARPAASHGTAAGPVAGPAAVSVGAYSL
jgi:hypothetical protein